MADLLRKSALEAKKAEKFPLSVVLDNVRSAMNVGSIFRTCDAFQVESLILCGITAFPPNPEIHKTALGSTESVSWEYREEAAEALEHLKSTGWRIVGVEQTKSAISLSDYHPNAGEKTVLVFGNELHGIQPPVLDLCDSCVEIPQFGMKHSLNISVSAGVVLWDLLQKIRK